MNSYTVEVSESYIWLGFSHYFPLTTTIALVNYKDKIDKIYLPVGNPSISMHLLLIFTYLFRFSILAF